MRGNFRAVPVQPLSAAVASTWPILPPAAVVPAVTLLEYQPMRVLMSVLFTPAAATRIKTSPESGVGTGISSRYSSCSTPPCPLSSTPRMRDAIVMAACFGRNAGSRDRALGHFEMDLGAVVGMGAGDLLVELDAEAGLGGRDDAALLPADRLLQDLGVEAAPGLDALEDEEIRAAGSEMDVGRALDRTAIEMRRDLRVVGLGHAGDLLRLEQAADAAERHLQDGGGAQLEHAGELVLGGKALAGRDRNRGSARHQRHLLRHLRRRRLLEPQGIVGLEPLGEADGAGGGELAVGAEQEISLGADGLADQATELLAQREGLERGLARIEHRIGGGRI